MINYFKMEAEVEEVKQEYGKQCTILKDVGDFAYRVTVRLPGYDGCSIKFQLPGDYPSVEPEIMLRGEMIPDHEREELISLINNIMSENPGAPIIKEVVDFVTEWLGFISFEDVSENFEDLEPFIPGSINKGKKRSKEKRKNVAEKLKTRDEHRKETPTTSTGGSGIVAGKRKDKKSKVNKAEQSEVLTEKKPPMRTCIDVINRIKSDEGLPQECFRVGYLDRFKGVLEKDFSDFKWVDPASVDHTILCIPQHRVLYFKYKTLKVWDKAERLDLMFGSTAETSRSIYEIIAEYDEKEERALSAVGLEPNTQESTCPKFKSGKPTHFICFRVKDSAVHQRIADLQEEIMRVEPMLAEFFVPPAAAHITVCVMRIEALDKLADAIQILKSSKPDLSQMVRDQESLCLKGIGCFHQSVLYAKIANSEALDNMREYLRSRLEMAGINMKANNDRPNDFSIPHLTILKGLKKPAYKKCKHIMPTLEATFSDFNIGFQPFDELHLCPSQDAKESDGFYRCLVSIQLNKGELNNQLNE